MRIKRLVPVFAAALTFAFAAPAESQVWVHPQAAAQPTARGKTIKTLATFNGDLYAGYGDYGANTGPIAINPFDVATKAFEGPFFADTEEVEAFRELDGRLFVPHADTRVGADYSVLSSAGWRQRDAFASLHVFDAARTPDSLWLCGSNGADGTVWRSTDDGATWRLSLSVPPWSGQPDDYVRVYFCAAEHGRLHVLAAHRLAQTDLGPVVEGLPAGRAGRGHRASDAAGASFLSARAQGRWLSRQRPARRSLMPRAL
jgi:hypothetical protein